MWVLIEAAQAGDHNAAADLLPLVYDELRKLAAMRMAEEAPRGAVAKGQLSEKGRGDKTAIELFCGRTSWEATPQWRLMTTSSAILLRTKHNNSRNGRHAKAALFGSEIA